MRRIQSWTEYTLDRRDLRNVFVILSPEIQLLGKNESFDISLL